MLRIHEGGMNIKRLRTTGPLGAQGTGHIPRLILGTHSLLNGQGLGVLEKSPNIFHSARESNPGSRL